MTDFSQYAPATKAEVAAAAIAAAPPAPAPETASAPAAPAPAPLVRPEFIGGPPRTFRVVLDHPLALSGREYHAITLRRPTAVEVGRYFEELSQLPASEDLLYFPCFVDDAGERVPDLVLRHLDPDDHDTVMGLVVDFLPRRLRALRGDPQPASMSGNGAPTEPTSSP